MKKPPPFFHPHPFFTFFIALSASVPHIPAMAQQALSTDLDNKAITNIQFKLGEDNLDQFSYTIPKVKIAERVVNNLTEWHYPIHSASTTPFTHTLLARIGRITYDKTPVGFSFGAGNSDPRAPDFQKADVLPVTCNLSAINRRQKPVENRMEFSASPFIEAAKKPSKQANAIELLADHVSTVCFNLLEDSDIKKQSNPESTVKTKPGWTPEITIEVKEKPAIEKNAPENEGGRKEITIHNKGAPVIIKFGHDRL